MAYLTYGLHHAEGFIVITGEVGTGKTMLVENLLSTIAESNFVIAKIVTTQLAGDDLLYMVAAGFGIGREDLAKGSLLRRIEEFVVAQHRSGKRALLIVDEAQNLTPRAVEELRMLSNFQLGDQALLQSFLIGQPDLRAMMQGAQMQQLRQRVIASYHLGPLDKAETQAYIEHRLKHVDWKDDPKFDLACFDLIHELTGGIPRRINTLCNRLLLAAFLAERHVLETADVQAIAHEIREELGPDAPLSAVSVVESDAAPPGSPLMARLEAGRLHAHFDNVEERIDRLEKTVAAAVDLLHRLLHPDKAAKPGTPAKR